MTQLRSQPVLLQLPRPGHTQAGPRPPQAWSLTSAILSCPLPCAPSPRHSRKQPLKGLPVSRHRPHPLRTPQLVRLFCCPDTCTPNTRGSGSGLMPPFPPQEPRPRRVSCRA